ncbi:MAG: hypothetical protein ACREDE_09370, partial [Thermoplasmata archaeon]
LKVPPEDAQRLKIVRGPVGISILPPKEEGVRPMRGGRGGRRPGGRGGPPGRGGPGRGGPGAPGGGTGPGRRPGPPAGR